MTKPNTSPLVSIILPSFNYDWCITETINSVLQQTLTDWELIIVDDASSDNSVSTIKKIQEKYPDKMRLITSSQLRNQGLSASLKTGINHARSPYIAILEADDILYPTSLEHRLSLIQAHPEVVLIHNGVELFGEVELVKSKTELLTRWRLFNFEKLPCNVPYYAFGYLFQGNTLLNLSTAIVRRDALANISFNDRYGAVFDWWFVSQLSTKGKFYCLPTHLTKWRIHSRSYSALMEHDKNHRAINENFKWEGLQEYMKQELRRIRSVSNAPDPLLKNQLELEIEKQEFRQELRQQVIRQRALIKRLQNEAETARDALQKIEQSVGWQLAKRIYLLLERIIPTNSPGRAMISKTIISTIKTSSDFGDYSKKWYRNVKKRIQSGLDYLIPLQPFLANQNPLVSIIIPTFNNKSLTVRCLRSIQRYTPTPFEIIIVDNGSRDGTPNILRKLRNATVILNPKNQGFAKACNIGASVAKANLLMFLNNDTEVSKDWLQYLINTLSNDPKCAAAGSALMHYDGTLQEAGCIIWRDGSTLGYGRNCNINEPEYSYQRSVDYCSAAALMVKKELFLKVGGFDEGYQTAYCEDVDLAMKLKEAGYCTIYQPKSVVFHREFSSSPSPERAIELQVINKKRFIQRWATQLVLQFPPSPKNILVARISKKTKKILVIDDKIPTPEEGGGYPRAHTLLKMLASLGYQVTFFPLVDSKRYEPHTGALQQNGIEVMYGNPLNFHNFASQRPHYYDIIIVSRPHNIRNAIGPIRRFFTNARVIYDAEALFAFRNILKQEVSGKILSQLEKSRLINEEASLAETADDIIVVSEKEKNELAPWLGSNKPIHIWGHAISARPTPAPFEKRKNILFVGGFLKSGFPNEDALLLFCNHIFPKIQNQLNCSLIIAGKNQSPALNRLASSKIKLLGYVRDLTPLYNYSRIFIVPHRYSAGIPCKLLEAMAYGIPSVVSELTAQQLNIKSGEALVGRSPNEFAQEVIRLYTNKNIWENTREKGLQLVKTTCHPETMKQSVKNIIESA